MSKLIIEHKGYYLIWSSVVDAPVAVCDSEDELLAYWKEEYGSQGLRLIMNEKKVHGHIHTRSLEYVSVANRAGPNEQTLTDEEIYRAYCLQETLNGWSPYEKE